MEETEHWRLRLLELEEAQRALGLTRHKDMAERLEVEPSYYSRLRYPPGKKGRKNLGLDTLRAAVKAFDLRYDWFDLPLGSLLPSTPDPKTAPQKPSEDPEVRFSIVTNEPEPGGVKSSGVSWPFKETSYVRFQGLLDSLDERSRAEALRDLDSLLAAGVTRWEQRARVAQETRRLKTARIYAFPARREGL